MLLLSSGRMDIRLEALARLASWLWLGDKVSEGPAFEPPDIAERRTRSWN